MVLKLFNLLKKKNILKVNNHNEQTEVAFTAYADFEDIAERATGCVPHSKKPCCEAEPTH